MSTVYLKKYLKYKNKYLKLKNLMGAGNKCIGLTYEIVQEKIKSNELEIVEVFTNETGLVFNKLNKECGRGSFKKIYIAIDDNSKKLVAWHEIDITAEPLQSGLMKKRLINEVQLVLSVLDHKNILKAIHTWYDRTKKSFYYNRIYRWRRIC